MAGRQVMLGPINMPGTGEPGEAFFVTESFTLDPSIGPAARFALVVRNDPLGTGGLNSISFSLNDGFIEEDLPPSGVLVVPVALELSPTPNEINGPASGPEGHAAQLLIVARDPIGVPQRGTLRLAGARTNRRITTLLYLAVAGPGRVGFRVVLLDAAGSVLGTTPIRVLRPGASEVVDLAAAASLLGVAFPEGSVGLDWVAEGGTRLFGHATEALTRDVRGGQLKPRRNPSAGPVLLTEVGIEPVAPSVVKEFLGI
jgi:hypothetical protein